MFIRLWDGQRKDGGVTNKYMDRNEPPSPFPLCVAIINGRCSRWCPFFHGLCITSDTPPVRHDLSQGDQTPHLISWPLRHSPCLFPASPSSCLSHWPWLCLSFSPVSARAPRVIISTRKSNVECQLPPSSLTHSHSSHSVRRTTTRSGERNPHVISKSQSLVKCITCFFRYTGDHRS